MVTLGYIGTPFYNTSLCLFYLLMIRYKYDNEKMERRIEFFLHFIPIVSALCVAVPPLFLVSILQYLP